jgi:resuscitation-promoting factor RpfA
MGTVGRAVPTLAPLGGAAYVLLELGPATLDAAQGSTTPDALVTAGCELAGLALLAWLTCVTSVCLLTALPGWFGRVADSVARRTAPTVLRVAVRASLGLGSSVIVGTTSALTLAALAPVSAVAATTPGSPPGWPSLDRAPVTAPHPDRPSRAAPYVVRPGDTLWDIAARHLGGRPTAADVARAWPAWWAVNREVVGGDPDLIHPGQRLTAPEDSR